MAAFIEAMAIVLVAMEYTTALLLVVCEFCLKHPLHAMVACAILALVASLVKAVARYFIPPTVRSEQLVFGRPPSCARRVLPGQGRSSILDPRQASDAANNRA